MNLQLLANSNIKLSPELAHIKIKYGYSYFSSKINNFTVDNSLTVQQLFILDRLFNRVNPINEHELKIANQVAKKSVFLDNYLPLEFTKNLKIQINVNSKMNQKFLNIATSLFNSEHPLIRSLSPNISYIYINTNQVVIGTNEFEFNNEKLKKISAVFTYSHIKKTSLEKAVTFCLFHEVSHCLEKYRNDTYGFNKDKVYQILKTLEYFINNIDENKNNKKSNLLIPQDYNLNNTLVENLYTLYGEIYADCSACLLQYNYDVNNNTYSHEKYDKYIDAVITSREIEKTVSEELSKDKIVIHDHHTVEGLKFLKNELLSNNQSQISDKKSHMLCHQAVIHTIKKTLYELLQNKPEFQKQIELLFNMSIVYNEVKISSKILPLKNYLYKTSHLKI